MLAGEIAPKNITIRFETTFCDVKQKGVRALFT